MGLRRRLAGWTSLVVAGTTLLVGAAALGAVAGNGGAARLAGAVLLGGVVALVLAQATRPAAVGPVARELDGLAREVAQIAGSAEKDRRVGELATREVARVSHAVNSLLDKVDAEHKALLAEAALARSLVAESPLGILVCRRDGAIRFVNSTFERLVEQRGDPIGRQPIEVVPIAEIQVAVEKALAGERVEMPCASGSYDLVLQAGTTDDGEAVVMLQDVTRFRQVERARTDFVANVSHELRTPIASIMGYAETLLSDRARLEPDTVQMVEAIYRNGTRLRDLFEDLLQLSRIEARRSELPLDRQPLRPILEAAVTSAADRASQRGQDFSMACPPELRASVNAEALTAIVGNLAANASAYTPRGGTIRVSAEETPEGAVVHVRDTGIGIDRAHHARIFERFYRVDEGRSRQAGGTGLGLAIVKHLAMASGCRVTLESERGAGSVFTVHLPSGSA